MKQTWVKIGILAGIFVAIVTLFGGTVSVAANTDSSVPSADEIGKYLIIGMGLGDSDTVNIQNAEEGADQEVVSSAGAGNTPGDPVDWTKQINFAFDGDLSLKSTIIENLGWTAVDDARPDDTVGIVDRLIGPDADNPVAPPVFEGIDFSGNIALTASRGDFATSNVDLFASIGVHCADTSLTRCENNVSNSTWIEDHDLNDTDLDAGSGISHFDPTALKNELGAWKTFIMDMSADATIEDCNSTTPSTPDNPFPQGVAPYKFCASGGQISNRAYGKGGVPVVFDLDTLDQDGDGFAVIDIDVDGSDFKLDNSDWILSSAGQTTIAFFRIIGDSNFLISNGTILYGDPASDVAPTGLGAIFLKDEAYGGDEVFNFSNVILSGIGIWDLGNIVSTTKEGDFGNDHSSSGFVVKDDGNTTITIQNGQGCAQFVGQTVLHGSANRWNHCALGPTHNAMDCGDLPEAYSTTMTDNGPGHYIGDLFMGDDIDSENDGQPSLTALGDDGPDVNSDPIERRQDEDGVIPITSAQWKSGTDGGEIEVTVTDNSGSSSGGWLKGWLDFDNDGIYDVTISQAISTGATHILFDIPAGLIASDVNAEVYARFRLFDATTEPVTEDVGMAINGEVEDYYWNFTPLTVTLRGAGAQTWTGSTGAYLLLLLLMTILTGAGTLFHRRFGR